MNIISGQRFDEERALYGSRSLKAENCRFEGSADGESAFKECWDIDVQNCFFDLRYPMWHVDGLTVQGSEMTENCRAALWYSHEIKLCDTKMHGIKALRECSDISVERCDIISPEFGWFCRNISMTDSSAQSEYCMLRSENLNFKNVDFKGKYSFQYITNSLFENCVFDTKDAFWHARNVTVRNCDIKGEYLGWYSEGLTLENCRIYGTQPLCYCKSLTLIDCEMTGCDLAFEKSEVDAVVTTPVDSIKNPLSGCIKAPSAGEIIRDDPMSKGEILLSEPAVCLQNR